MELRKPYQNTNADESEIIMDESQQFNIEDSMKSNKHENCPLDVVCDVIRKIKEVKSEDIVVRQDSSESLSIAVNPNRARLLVFLRDIFVYDIFNTTDSYFFYYYLQTLQPFMFVRSLISEDEASEYGIYQKMLYIFEYPCGTQSIQIKVCLKDEGIVLVSFHKGASGIEALAHKYQATIDRWENGNYLFSFTPEIRLFTDHIYYDITAERFDESRNLYISSVSGFFEDYRLMLSKLVNSIIEQLAYYSIDELQITNRHKISVYSAISLAEFYAEHKRSSEKLSNHGKIHALISLATLVNNNVLTTDIVDQIKLTNNQEQIFEWLKNFDVTGLPEIKKLLLIGGEQND